MYKVELKDGKFYLVTFGEKKSVYFRHKETFLLLSIENDEIGFYYNTEFRSGSTEVKELRTLPNHKLKSILNKVDFLFEQNNMKFYPYMYNSIFALWATKYPELFNLIKN